MIHPDHIATATEMATAQAQPWMGEAVERTARSGRRSRRNRRLARRRSGPRAGVDR
jgi:hypothetical protein